MGAPRLDVTVRELPGWAPADLAAALGAGDVAVLDGVEHEGRRAALVAWELGPELASVDDGLAAAAGLVLPEGTPPLLGAAVGSVAWDGAARFRVPGSAALFDRAGGRLFLRGDLPAGLEAGGSPYAGGGEDADGYGGEASGGGLNRARPLWPRAEYIAAVQEAQARMAAGEIQKVILSVPFEAPCSLAPAEVFRRLGAGAEAGLGFLLPDGPAGHLVGLSPEPLVLLLGRRAVIHLLAGTRAGGDFSLELDLLANPKDRSEHLVAVEQARRDLLAVCEADSVFTEALMALERHPGLVHLASLLSGQLRADATGADLIRACFPAGTVGGVPRDLAVALIDRLEPIPRDWYAGAVGALLPDGGLQLWLTIRSLRLEGGVARLRTGAGLVKESVPESEWQECMNKARRTLTAIGAEVADA